MKRIYDATGLKPLQYGAVVRVHRGRNAGKIGTVVAFGVDSTRSAGVAVFLRMGDGAAAKLAPTSLTVIV